MNILDQQAELLEEAIAQTESEHVEAQPTEAQELVVSPNEEEMKLFWSVNMPE